MTLVKGALVAFTPTFLPVPLPSVTVFQFNPESLTHTWSQPAASGAADGGGGTPCGRPGTLTGHPMAVPGMPGEQFTLTVMVDANEDIAAGGVSGDLAQASGVYTRLAAMEMLLYPAGGGATSALLGQVSAALGIGSDDAAVDRSVPESTVPVTLFVWGPFRIVPVRLTSLAITETLYDGLLNPIQAEAKLELRVMTPAELQAATNDSDVLAKLATVAYTYTFGVRQAAAAANLANAAQTIGFLPH
jgi:hypothetical protein